MAQYTTVRPLARKGIRFDMREQVGETPHAIKLFNNVIDAYTFEGVTDSARDIMLVC